MAASDAEEPIQTYRDIAYLPTDGVYHQFDLYLPPGSTSARPLVCFVHGGAWRSEDKSQHEILARRIVSLTGYPVAIPNYRLTTPSTQLKHPAHAKDALDFLHFILDWEGPSGGAQVLYDASRIFLCGHSCSAHMFTSIFLSPPNPDDSSAVLNPSQKLVASVRGVVLSEGIYDIDLLLRSFPGYREWFIAPSFDDRLSYASFNTLNYEFRQGVEHIRWLVIHSKGDTLVDEVQSEGIYKRLCALLQDCKDGNGNAALGSVERYWDLTSEHNVILKEKEYPELVSQFVLRDTTAK
ncbi:hypothetical protein EW026_g6514 [Hermanssonia centrifuga]|uniref:BD-FAE-like domain-containing protein n=1 Tax=Hermanssonia centrifuga TaxID=98765 RepID=A0A4V3X9P9_9APHY|nr:hypothetical protein EW026_g6514 [Hermanssonia centrifuga]